MLKIFSTGSLTMLSANTYDRRNLSKDYLVGNATEYCPLRTSEFYKERDIDVRLNTHVASIDIVARKVGLSNGGRIGFARGPGDDDPDGARPVDPSRHVHAKDYIFTAYPKR